MTPINLFTTYYNDPVPSRQAELDFCIRKNLEIGFNTVTILIEDKDLSCFEANIGNLEKVNLVKVSSRPTFNNFFSCISQVNAINIIANSDIFFPDLNSFRSFYTGRNDATNVCLALSRWDYFSDGSSNHFNREDSQDTWVFYGKPNFVASHDFCMGVAGCDNRLAYDLAVAGFNLLNPSKSIKTLHYHQTNVRHYLDQTGQVKERVSPPYKLIQPY